MISRTNKERTELQNSSFNSQSSFGSFEGSDEEDAPAQKAEQQQQLQPLFLFLASSFNVQLVYVILKGITQFSYLAKNNDKSLKKINKLDFLKTGADMTLTLREIKIKDFKKWQEMKTDEDLKEVNEDITYNLKAQLAMQNRITNR